MKDKLAKLDRRQVAAYAVIVLFILVTVGHVANYAGSFEVGGWVILGWFYAIAVELSIVICAWMTQWKTTERWAWRGYVLAVVASGVLNVAQVRPWQRDFGAWVYAVFPTIAQALLGFLARDAGKFTKSQSKDERVVKLSKELAQAKAQVAQVGQFKTADKDIFAQLCTEMNGDKPTTEQGVQRALVLSGYWPVSGGTARNWAKREES